MFFGRMWCTPHLRVLRRRDGIGRRGGCCFGLCRGQRRRFNGLRNVDFLLWFRFQPKQCTNNENPLKFTYCLISPNWVFSWPLVLCRDDHSQNFVGEATNNWRIIPVSLGSHQSRRHKMAMWTGEKKTSYGTYQLGWSSKRIVSMVVSGSLHRW